MKAISKILVIAMIVSLFVSFTGFAYDRMAEELIATVTEEKIWTDGEFVAEKDVTAEQVATMFGNALGIDNAKDYIPGYAEGKPVTRTALAVAADKLGFELVPNYGNRAVYRELYMDTDAVTDAEYQSITNAAFYGTVLALAQKKFAPDANADCLTAAKAAVTLRTMMDTERKFSERAAEKADDPEKYEVYQKGVLQTNAGMAGFGLVARFDGAPGEIYIARTTVKPLLEDQWGGAAAPVTLVNVIDPDGNIIARVSMDIDDGKVAKVINIPEGKAGIYQISFTAGRQGDLCEIAVNGAKSWGVRGETLMIYTETTPKTGYIYIPNSFRHLSLAIGGLGETLTLSSLDGKEVYKTEEALRCVGFAAIETDALKPGSVYKIEVDEDYRDLIEIYGAGRVISPTAEMAADLKSCFVDVTDKYGSFTLAGPLQARARAKMIEIYEKANGNFTVPADKPFDKLPAMEDIDNPIAEAQLFSSYYGSLQTMDNTMNGQCLDPSKIWFGAIVGHKVVNGESAYKATDFTSEDFNSLAYFGASSTAFSGAAALNSELNGYYDDPQLRDRLALAQLFTVLYMTQEGTMLDNNVKNSAGSWHNDGTNFQFYSYAHAYGYARKMMDAETRDICDTAITSMADHQLSVRGHGPTNQAGMNFYATMAMYETTNDPYYHEFLKRQMDAYYYPSARPSYQGQTAAGYYLESGGCDGSSYALHNEDFFARVAHTYLELPEDKRDPEYVAKIYASHKRNLDFMDKFQTGWVDGLDKVYATNFASRTRSGLGGGSAYVANNFLINDMPQARAIWSNNPNPSIATSAVYANTDEVAYTHLKKAYDRYDKWYGPEQTGYLVGATRTYEMMHGERAEKAVLPFEYEGDYNVWDQPGLVALKHKGIYMMSFYDTTIPEAQSFISPKSWMGGAPTFTWIEGLGYATSSDKPVNYNALPGNMLQIYNKINYKPYWKEEEFIHGAIVGTDANGEVFASGKERSKLTWLEEGKSFKIGGVTPIEGKEISWIYDLTDEGVELTAGIDSISGKEEFWMQIPIVDQSVKNAEFKVTHENGKLVSEYKGKKMIITWDASLEYKMNDHQPENKVRTQVLKIKLPADSCKATIKIVAE